MKERLEGFTMLHEHVRLFHRNSQRVVEGKSEFRFFDSSPKMRSVSRLLPRASRAFPAPLLSSRSLSTLPSRSPVFGLKPVSFLKSVPSPSAATLRLTIESSSAPRPFHSTSHALAVETIKVPAMSESISEGTLKQWLKKKGDYVELDEEIATIETDKVRSLPLAIRRRLTDFHPKLD